MNAIIPGPPQYPNAPPGPGQESPRPFQFSLLSLLVWSPVLGLAFGYLARFFILLSYAVPADFRAAFANTVFFADNAVAVRGPYGLRPGEPTDEYMNGRLCGT